MLLTGVEAQHSVTLSSKSLCAVTGSTVKIPCTFTTPPHFTVVKREWYRVQSSEGEPQDLSTDPQYSGRVSVSTVTSDCELTVRNVSVNDSGVYNFRFKTQRRHWISASSRVRLTVTGVQSKKCWGVTYTSKHVCALKGTSIDLSCSYKHPTGLTVLKNVWFIEKKGDVEPVDVREDEEYQGRVQYTHSSQNKCGLKITNLTERDTQTYKFRFYTDDPKGKYTGQYGVFLSVTDVKVTVSDWRDQYMTLSCITTCTLSNNPTYIWYKNGQRVSDCKSASCSVAAVSGALSYSCAVEGHDSLLSPPVCVGENCWAVTYTNIRVCALDGSSVEFAGSYSHPSDQRVNNVFWHSIQSRKDFLDLRQETQFLNRVEYVNKDRDSNLKMIQVTKKDSGEYRLRIITNDRKGFSGRPGVVLNVTDLRKTVADWPNWQLTLSCITSCTLSNNFTYVWYKNGQRVTDKLTKHNKLYLISFKDVGNYSCAVRGHEDLRSPEQPKSYCLPHTKNCWGVTYTPEHVCALKGTSIDLSCSYKHPAGLTVLKSVWFIKEQADGEPVDVREDEEYQGRVQYTQSSQNKCSLRITNLRKRDAQTYRFRFYTDDPKDPKYTGEPGVPLSVTDLKVTVSDWRDQYMTLSCITTCTLSNNPTYIWYKNGQRVSDCKSASCSVAAVSGAVSYSCAVEGHDSLLSPPVYSPKNTRAVVLSSGDTVEGDSVTLSCSSDANPPVLTYSWFKQRAAADTLLTTGQNYSISNISPQHSGLYYCTAHNQLGQHNSTPKLLNVLYSPKNTSAVVLPSGDTVEGDSVTLSCSSDANPPVLNYTWFKQGVAADTLLTTGQNYSISNISSQHSGLYYCTAHNQLGQHNSTPTLLDVLYSPKNTRAVVLSSGDTVEGDSVTLSCSSDANPPVLTYSWFKKRAAANTLLTTGQNYSISSISSQHSGLYYCIARNQLGQQKSTPTLLDVFYSPKNTRTVVLSSGDMVEGSSVTLSCCSDANPPVLTYSWFKQRAAADTLLTTGQNYSISNISSQHSGLYYCTAHNKLGRHSSTPTLLNVLYPPKNTRAVVLSSGDTVEGDSVTLSCSSDANPPVLNYSWFKQRAAADTLLTTGQNYSISSISSQHSGLYYCTAHNKLGQHNSTPTLLDVLYYPKNTRAVVFPSGDTVEGDSVTLSCSSDANPPVLNYTWFKQRAAADTLLTTGQNYIISNISSQHSGLYYCTAHNQLGQHNSTPTLLHVLDSPKNTRAVVLSSGDTVEGDSVTLSCSSDANPPVLNFSWFKQRAAADTLLTTGQNYSIRNISSQHSGLYYCTAHNQLGQHNSTPTLLNVFYFYSDSPKNTRAVVLSSEDTVEGDSVTLSCSSDANPTVLTYAWFKQRAASDTLLTTGQNYSISNINPQHSGLYYCTAHNQLGQHNSTPTELDVLYFPKNTRAVVLSSGDMMEGGSVTLSCSSDANPHVLTYSWFKQRAAADTLLTTGQNYSISSISSQHSGLYYCTAHNKLGRHSSTPTFLDVLYSPKNTRAVVLSSGDTVEGDSVTLSCSSDANPPVLTYSWFKQRAAADTLLTTGQNYSISNISSQHSGLYYCTAHNQLGQHNSTPTLLDVLYFPKNTRAVVLSSGDTVEGDSVTLSCSSDANPTVLTYSWFKQRATADTLLTTGQNYSISNISSQHSGLYYCTAHNQLGQHNSTPTLLDVLCK
ncbi:sialoadhesin-like [Clarias gariepinus]|uniref:sialoadhesin-like n=1 Tax=Clarias gariepinus TaxID=13013 RepID=UPI00234D77CA|nr:sialoadhesin-like [Clarias gariepinus]